MLRLIPRAAHRFAYRAAHRLRKLYWRVFKPEIPGCSVIARNAANEVLLVRLSYGRGGWQFPGGGMGRGEDPLAAGRREFVEETGLALAHSRLLGVSRENLHGAVNLVNVVAGQAEGTPQVDGREVVEARWFAPGALPEPRSATVDARLAAFGRG